MKYLLPNLLSYSGNCEDILTFSERKPGENRKLLFLSTETMLAVGSLLKEYGLLDLVDWYN